jgi:hypothetical protein
MTCGASVANVQDTKNTTIGVRVDDELLAVIKQLAKEEERPIAAMARILMMEALRARSKI